jgi:hypothetical protein
VSRVEVKAEVTVYEKDDEDWGRTEDKIAVETYWNDDGGTYAVLVIDGHRYTVAARDLRVAVDAVTKR